MVRPSLCDYSDAYVLMSGTITVANTKTAINSSQTSRKQHPQIIEKIQQ